MPIVLGCGACLFHEYSLFRLTAKNLATLDSIVWGARLSMQEKITIFTNKFP